MTTEQDRALVRGYLEEMRTRGNLAWIDEHAAPDVAVYFPGMPEGIHGTEALQGLVSAVRHAFPDLTVKVEDVVAEGDKLAVRWSSRGTQRGEWETGIAPTGRSVTWTGISIYRIADGKIREERLEEDLRGLEEQIGVVQRMKPA